MLNDILVWIMDLGYWAWWTFGVVLIILEIFAPTFFMLWLGISAGVVGVIVLLIPSMTWEYQWSLFAIFSVVSLAGGRFFLKRNPGVEDHFKLNQRGAQYVGRSFMLTEAIVNGRGKVHVDDTQWAVSGPALDAGETVTVVDTDGILLVVEAAKT